MSDPQDIEMFTDDGDVRMACHETVPNLEALSESEDSDGPSLAARRMPRSYSQSSHAKKRVSWDRIHTREFALVVGDHPLCQDGLPVSLDWQHTDNPEPAQMISCQAPLSERRTSYIFPRRLSYDERRKRLRSVSGLTDDQVKNDEIDLVVRTLQESWDSAGEDGTPPFDPTPISEQDAVMMQVWDDIIADDINVDFGDMSDFEWTD